MFSKFVPENDRLDVSAPDRFAWYQREGRGETQKEMESRLTRRWLEENLPEEEVENLLTLLDGWDGPTAAELLAHIAEHDAAPLVDLLYPRFPQLFLESRKYTINAIRFSDNCQPPFTPEVLQSCLFARAARLSAACLFAVTGAATCLEALLDLGVDPNGLDTPESWSYIELPNNHILPVAPMDCAQLADQEDCQLVLEMFGGVSLHENLPPDRSGCEI